MAPLNDLIHLFPITLKDRLNTAIPAVFNPAFYPQPKSRRLSMVAKEDSLNPSFNDDPCPYLFHRSLTPIPAKLFGETYKTKTRSRLRSSPWERRRGWGQSSLELSQTPLKINDKNQSKGQKKLNLKSRIQMD